MIKQYGLTLFLLPLIILIFLLSVSAAHADSFYDSGGDIAQCALSLAVGVYFDYPSGVGFNANDLAGDSGMAPFSSLATDRFPSAHRFASQAVHVSVPPLTKVHIYGVFKNDNPYTIHMPEGGILFTSFVSPQESDISRLMADTTGITTQSKQVLFAGARYTRSGNGVGLGDLGDIGAFTEIRKNLYTFTTIQPIHIAKQVTYSFDASGNLLVHVTSTIQNISNYQEDNIHVSDIFDPYYHIDEILSLSAHETKTISYDGNIGTVYPATIAIPALQIQDPNTHTEKLQESESIYEQNPNATAIIFPRDDEDAPNGWAGNQSSLPQLDANSQIDITLIPYTLLSVPVTLTIHPHVVIQKMQNGSQDDVSVHTGDTVIYTLLVQNIGNAPATDVFINDNLPPDINIIDPGGATVCLFTDVFVQNYLCHHSLLWHIPLLGIGETTTLTFKAVVANTAFLREEILNHAVGEYNENNSIFSNITTLVVLPTIVAESITEPITIVLSSYSSLDTGSILGVVWHDINKDGIYETNEDPIAQARVTIAFHQGDLDAIQTFQTNLGGYYEIDALPFDTPITVHMTKPVQYAFESTYDTYRVTLHDGGEANVSIDHDIVNISAPYYTNQVSLGVYNMQLANTGQNVLPVFVIAIIGIVMILPFCFRKHIPNQHIERHKAF